MYMGFLMSEPHSPTCTRLSDVMGISHDSVNRFLLRESYAPRDPFEEASRSLNLQGGTLNKVERSTSMTVRSTNLTANIWPWWDISGPASIIGS